MGIASIKNEQTQAQLYRECLPCSHKAMNLIPSTAKSESANK